MTTMKVFLSTVSVFVLALLALVPSAAAQDDWGEELPCDGVLADPELLAATLAQVPKYATTYVLAFRDENSELVLALDAPALRQGEVSVALYGSPPAESLATGAGLEGFRTDAFDTADAGSLFAAVLSGDVGVALLWAPLAGLAALELDFNYEISLRTAAPPTPSPPAFTAAIEAAAGSTPSECAAEVETILGSYGVVPAEKLIPPDIRDFLHRKPPPRDLAAALAGAPIYDEHCAKCHGPDAVAATDALAPVDLLISTPRFSFPGFLYIVLNGRSQNGMPGFNGTLTQDEIELVYQFARERSYGVTGLTNAASARSDATP